MDRRIREAERRGDWETANHLRCKAEGCAVCVVHGVETWEDHRQQRWVLEFDIGDGQRLNMYITMRRFMRQEYVEDELRAFEKKYLARCPRCGEPNDQEYTREVIDGLKRQQQERLRYEPGPGPFSRESLLRRVPPPRAGQ